MSGIDDLCACLAVCCTCCFFSCNEASGLFCFYKCCNCKRRNMDDNDFERTVEELYAHGKDGDAPRQTQTHVLELQPRGASKGTDGSVSAQPAPRPSMEAPARRSADVERIPGEPRAERRDRTREWVHAHSASEPGLDAAAPRARSHSRPRSKSQADGGAREDRQPQMPRTPGGSVRAAGKRGREAPPSDAQAYVNAVEGRWKRSQDEGREGMEDGPGAEAVAVRRGEGLEEWERPERNASSPPRLDIPASLQPGRPSSWTPSQLQLEPQAAGASVGQAGAS